jgi:SAM-dependent methyltransferase
MHLNQLPIEILDAVGEDIPLPDESVDVVYVRQVLHHIRDLPQALKECARVLKHDGVFLACREHVVDDEQQLAVFLQQHPVHQLAGGENAYPLDAYLTAIKSSGLKIAKVLAPWQSIINAFPEVKTRDELKRLPRTRLSRKLGVLGSLLGYLPGVNTLMWKRISRPVPGRMYSFLAIKP